MDRMLYVAMSGASEVMKAQAIHANNLANANTTGFKSDLEDLRAMPVFGDGLPTRVYAGAEKPASDTSLGGIRITDNPMDVAIAGEGWMAIRDHTGAEAYTRRGDMTIDRNNFLINGQGQQILNDNGPISIPAHNFMSIQTDGTITIQPVGTPAGTEVTLSRLKLVGPSDDLTKGPDGNFNTKSGVVLPGDPNVRLISGAIEESNVNAVAELMGLINLARQFEMGVKVMKTAEENASVSAQILQTL